MQNKITNNPVISIVLLTYNGERWLADSIKSIINQTEKNWELIIVNDCSKDNTLQIAKEFAKNDNRIIVISNEINKKLPASLNIGFSKARGEFFTWTSDDNLFKPNALEKMLDYLKCNPNIDLVSMNYDIINEKGIVLKQFVESYYQSYKRHSAELINSCNVGAVFMYRRTLAEKVGKYDINMFCAEDYDYWCRIALVGNIGYTNDNIYQYRINPNSLSSTKKYEIQRKTLHIKEKYANDFFNKFNFTNLDKKIFLINALMKSSIIPDKHIILWLFLKIYSYFIKIVVLLVFFWNSKLRKKIRNFLLFRNIKYSFLK